MANPRSSTSGAPPPAQPPEQPGAPLAAQPPENVAFAQGDPAALRDSRSLPGRGPFQLTAQQQPAPPPPPYVAPPWDVHDGPEQITCRPPPDTRLEVLGDCVIGHWIGQWKEKRIQIAHGTPVRDMPEELLRMIRQTPGQRIGPVLPNVHPSLPSAPVTNF